ncbi:DnaJ subfamily A member 5 [Fasciolopsis buskii]|uniref:DnaJ subfamily A member 5 n=1 Tax=Fasciolopsis buskii TaxID=27845 RepID=A0A8E0VHK0_9TREM|nr:DnaJ subfamily A member 5 [Fasciolopsis buski]
MSLQWHPDKNASSLEDTTVIFQQIQEAYRVLSDPQERAWYDSHRAQILQSGGQKAQMGSTAAYEEERVDVFEFFTRSCFENFDDGKKGFYTVYRKVFDDITDEEQRARAFVVNCSSSESEDEEQSGRTRSSSHDYPTFGHSDSNYADVVAPFYQFWETFRTHKNYTWVETYDIRCADSRQERRAMEQENRRLRNAARRKRNEEVRQLVAFVKKRDRRVAAERVRIQQLNEESQIRTQKMAKEARQREAIRLTEAWNEELSFGGLTSQWAEEFEAELARMEAELDGVHDQAVNETSVNKDNVEEDTLSDVNELYCIACDKLFASVKAKINHEASKRHKKQSDLLRKILLEEEQNAKNESELVEKSSDIDQPFETQGNLDEPEGSPLREAAPEVKLSKRAKKAQRKRRKEEEKLVASTANLSLDDPVSPLGESTEVVDSTTLESSSEQKEAVIKPITVLTSPDVGTAKPLCKTCNTEFLSRNQLFAHLKQSGHAQLKHMSVSSVKASSKKGKKKR